MPPIPFDQDVLDLIDAINRRKKDLVEFQIPRLKTCKGPLSVQQQYVVEVRDDTEALTRQIEELDLIVDDQNGERRRAILKQSVEEFYNDLASIRKDTRMALLVSKQNIDAKNSSNREELFYMPAVSKKEKDGSNGKVTEDALMRANNDVTEALRRTIGLMQGELERSVLSTQMLDSSTAALRSTSTTYDTLDNVLTISKHLVTALEKADRMDRLLILAGLIFFFLVVLFILKQRVIDRGLRIALFWTRFIPRKASTTVDEVTNKIERGEATVIITTIANVVSGMTSTLVCSSSSVSTPLAQETIAPPHPLTESITNIITSEQRTLMPSEIHDEL